MTARWKISYSDGFVSVSFLALNNAAHAQQQGTQVKTPVQHNYVSNVQAQNNHRQLIQ